VEGEGLRFFVDGDLYGPVRSVRLETGAAIRILVPAGPGPGRV